MSRSLFAAALCSAALLLGQSRVFAQLLPPENHNIVTVDGVRLKATFYPSTTKDAPTVLMLHPIGEGKGMKTPEFKNLAESLQKANYSVMMFDFRGHGDSTAVEAKFWNFKPNLASVKVANPKDKETIDVKDYLKNGKAYLPILVNDIAAVRSFLDRRNDAVKDCNTSSIIVIGVDSGASLGAIWINSEWFRYKFTPDPLRPLNLEITKASNYSDCAGKDILGAVFLTIQPDPLNRLLKLEAILKVPCKDHAMPTALFCGLNDKQALTFSRSLANKLKVANSPKHAYIATVELDTNLTGMKLLQKGLKSDKYIVDTLANYVDDRKRERVDQDFANTNYRWLMPNGTSFPAREKKGDKTLMFDDYSSYIPK